MSRRWHRVRRVWAITGTVLLVVWVGWCAIAFRPSAEARAALSSSPDVAVRPVDEGWLFEPASAAPDARALLFFPGGLVDARAYAPLMQGVARAGHRALLVRTPWRGAFGRAESVPVLDRAYARTRALGGRWIVAGHSRGGKAAAHYAAGHPDAIDALVLIGTSHPREVDLAGLRIPVVRLLGGRDPIASPARAEAHRHRLPAHAVTRILPGANHSQFGDYGLQPGDRTARMARAAQRAATLDVLQAALERPGRPPTGDIR